ncbi:MAG: DsrE family protein [Candidatus Marsarchaeota archaeon]|nr:DsrE family protein [Candidatus Marsarchaeota archaeon]
MGGKIAIIIASDWDQKLKVTSGLHLAKRIYEVRQANGVDVVEVFLYAGGSKLLQSLPEEFENLIKELKQGGLTIKVCATEAKAWGLEENAKRFDIALEFARDAFSRYSREGFTVFTF